MALWLLLLHASGLDRHFLHTDDQENAEEHWDLQSHQAGSHVQTPRTLFPIVHVVCITFCCYIIFEGSNLGPFSEARGGKDRFLPCYCVCSLLVSFIPEQNLEINHIWWERPQQMSAPQVWRTACIIVNGRHFYWTSFLVFQASFWCWTIVASTWRHSTRASTLLLCL